MLLEMGFISSREDESRLTDSAQQGRLMDSVAGAIEARCGILYSEDFQNGQKFQDVEVRNPFL